LERARELYLAGDIDRDRYAQEQQDVKQRIADLADVSHSVILSMARMFEMPDEQWASLPRLKQKSLVQELVARATLVRDRLGAVRPSCAAYPLIRLALDGGYGNRCHSGSDGCPMSQRAFDPLPLGAQGDTTVLPTRSPNEKTHSRLVWS
jgi:hypothetical protein